MKYPGVFENVESAAALLGALASDSRIYVLRRLADGEVPAGVLAPELGISQPALSQHLSRLRRLGLVRIRREAQMVYYRCDTVVAKTMLAALSALPQAE